MFASVVVASLGTDKPVTITAKIGSGLKKWAVRVWHEEGGADMMEWLLATFLVGMGGYTAYQGLHTAITTQQTGLTTDITGITAPGA